MTVRKISLFILFITIIFISCKKDDNNDLVVTPPRDRVVQQLADKDSILGYLGSHYYNAADFDNNPDPHISELIISDEQVDAGYRLLSDDVETKTIDFAETTYEYYILKLNQGGGADSPTFSDQISVLYEGFLLDGTIFDSAVNPLSFNLIGNGTTIGGVIPGWRKVMPQFNVAEAIAPNGDGTDSFVKPGVGVMFLPSGLAYFSSSPSFDVPAYSPLIFKFELIGMLQIDFDNDGIPNYLEELTEDGEFTVDTDATVEDDDTDGDNIPNYIDVDDDGDGILTKNEIVVSTVNKPTRDEVVSITLLSNQVLLNKIKKEQNGSFTGTIITFTDSDLDGNPDYLDAN